MQSYKHSQRNIPHLDYNLFMYRFYHIWIMRFSLGTCRYRVMSHEARMQIMRFYECV